MRLFTLTEANRLASRLERAFSTILELNEKIIYLTRDINDLLSIWGQDIYNKDNQDNPYFTTKLTAKTDLTNKLNTHLNRLKPMGCIVRDINHGHVDFLAIYNTRPIMYCWKIGEHRVEHWHDTEESCEERKHISALLLRLQFA